MPTEDYKHQVVREDEQDYPAEGEWDYFVHDCHTPSLDEIKAKNAAVGTVWKCGSCDNRWKLINHTRGGGFTIDTSKANLVWRRITPIKEEGEDK